MEHSVKEAANSSADREYVAFRVGTQEYCVDIISVREIRGWTKATPLPHSPIYMRGVINLRGAVLPIVDLACRFGLDVTEPTPRSVIIVVHVNKQIVGLLVDAVSDILTVSDAAMHATPAIASEMAKTFVRGVYAIDGRMIGLIALNSILSASDLMAA